MDKMQEENFEFVRHELLTLLQAIDRDIIDVEYQVCNGEEYVEIQWLNHKIDHTYCKKVCVSADSLKALTVDVLKRV